ncbi:arginine/ornithine succinyltransferase subunit alpha [Paludibacterium purpuratum]|uniref:Arginine succinyltransferase n=1 Tax=Paludibacterium purpuratum TaxID=1144873 RepID=A0A4R7BAP9_9NEIS|nr:arginine/ornithine succinyltransferase subunit alpha [Paludibacterium purpuratum]TDR82030.1 arginine succinyltransferase [Paludibacterium purpuratum]
MLTVRPVRTADLPAIERLAFDSGIGVTSLPADRDRLFERIQRSNSSFEHEATAGAGYEYYAFVLVDDGQVVGTAAVAAAAGFDEPFYSYRNEIFVHASRTLRVHNRVHVLNLCHDLTGMVQLCGFYVDPAYRQLGAELLSRARLMFIAGQRLRFGKRIIAEMQGLHDEQGQSPFWNAIGRIFFDMDFPQVEQAFVTHSKSFIAELMPNYPIYVPLLPDEAQDAISQVHPDSERTCQILTREGFETDEYIDIFDGGAVLTADIDRLYTLQHSRLYRVEVVDSLPALAKTRLVGNERCAGYVAVLAASQLADNGVQIEAETAETLGVAAGAWIRVTELQLG